MLDTEIKKLEIELEEKKAELLKQQKMSQSHNEELANLKKQESAIDSTLAELREQNEQEMYSPEDYIEGIQTSLKSMSFTSAEEGLLFNLGLKLREFLLEKKKIRPSQQTFDRLDQIETMMNLYSAKIRKVKNDFQEGVIDEQERDMKLEYWTRIRAQDIQALQGE